MPNLLHAKGKYSNSSIEENANRGNYGKFTLEQTEARFRLHALKRNEGLPTYKEIVKHWYEEYGIEITPQSEKEWALTESNKLKIESKMEEMITAGEIEVSTISRQTLVNSISEGARSLAGFMKSVKHKGAKALKEFDADLTPWGILGIAKKTYLNATKDQLKEWQPQVENDLKIKKSCMSLAKSLSAIIVENSAELRKTVELADKMTREHMAADQSNKQRYREKQASLAGVAGNDIKGIESVDFEEVSLDKLRDQVS